MRSHVGLAGLAQVEAATIVLHNIRSLAGRFPRDSLGPIGRIFSSIAFSILSKAYLTPLGAIICAWGWFFVRATVGPMVRSVAEVLVAGAADIGTS
jgi:hypothetical protein